MGFFEKAWGSAAETYGAARAEKWGKVARFWRALQLLLGVLLIIGIVYMWTLGQEGRV
jgi:hypothetical protein